MSDQVHIVCAPADGAWTTRGASFDHRCSKCSKHVMLALSGQRLLRTNPAARLICVPCFVVVLAEKGEAVELLPPSGEQLAEAKTAIPNMWRERN
jgi:hypothetical protein